MAGGSGAAARSQQDRGAAQESGLGHDPTFTGRIGGDSNPEKILSLHDGPDAGLASGMCWLPEKARVSCRPPNRLVSAIHVIGPAPPPRHEGQVKTAQAPAQLWDLRATAIARGPGRTVWERARWTSQGRRQPPGGGTRFNRDREKTPPDSGRALTKVILQ